MQVTLTTGQTIEILEQPTDIVGLKFLPQMRDVDNDADWAYFTRHCSNEVSKQDYDLMAELVKKYAHTGVMEIGVSRNGDGSFTNAILQNKSDNVVYLGVDIEDKTHLDDRSKNIYTIKENSFNQQAIRDYAKSIGLNKISLLFIDGWHSVNAVINDWLYADMLSEDSIVVFHDTNYHPGPVVFLYSIDESKFKVEKYFEDQDDYGVSVAYKLK